MHSLSLSLSLSLNPLAFCLLNVVRREECFERRLDEKPPFEPPPPKPFEEGTLFCDDDDDDFDDVFVALKKEPLLLSVFFCPSSSSSSSSSGVGKGMRTNARMRPTSSFSASEQKFMREALALAERAYERWEVPVGCVFVNGETNDIIARGQNKTNETRNGTKHAEVVALESATTTLPASEEKTKKKKKKNDTFKDGKMDEKKSSAMDGGECAAASRVSVMEEVKVLDVYVTCEPCIMCASMLGQLPCTRKVIFGCANDKFGGGGTCLSVHEMDDAPSCADGAAMPKAYECVGGLFKDEAIELFQRFYVRGNPKAPVPHREVKEYPS